MISHFSNQFTKNLSAIVPSPNGAKMLLSVIEAFSGTYQRIYFFRTEQAVHCIIVHCLENAYFHISTSWVHLSGHDSNG